MTATPSPQSTPVHEPDFHELLPLRISRGRAGAPSAYSVVLDNTELAGHLAADGVKIDFVETGAGSMPRVTLVLAPDAVALDLDLDLIAYLREKAATDPKVMRPKCPECLQGKHGNCTGKTLDPVTDQMVWCGCGCHK